MKYLDLKAINKPYEHAADEVLQSGWYLRGEYTRRFEEAYAEYIGTRHCIGCGNGLDALTLIFRAYKELDILKDGDEVIVPANTYIASILAITENRLKPVLVEPSLDTLQIDDKLIERAITERTRAIMIVHLYGRCAYTPLVGDICRSHNLLLIEDNAQAHGSMCSSVLPQRRTGSLGHAAGHSFYPTKNLGAFGDAGAVTTDDEELAEMIRSLGNYGSSRQYVFDHVGRNSRIDELQAAVLCAKLKHLDHDNNRRKQIANRYMTEIANPLVVLPSPCDSNVYHIFPILCQQRDALKQHLQDCGIDTMIHYPIPPHRQLCYNQLNHLSLPLTEMIHQQELSIPCNQAMTDDEVSQVIDAINNFQL